jgi:hypothetical protein
LDTSEKYIGGHTNTHKNSYRNSSRLSRNNRNNDLAFGQPGEGKLVENLRKNPKFSPELSLVAKPMEEYLAISSFPR